MDKRGLTLAEVMEPLRGFNISDPKIDPRLKGMIQALPLLTKVLAEENRLTEQTIPAAAPTPRNSTRQIAHVKASDLIAAASNEMAYRTTGARRISPVAMDERAKAAFAKLAQLSRDERRVIVSKSMLAQWAVLDATVQSKLLQDVDGMVED